MKPWTLLCCNTFYYSFNLTSHYWISQVICISRVLFQSRYVQKLSISSSFSVYCCLVFTITPAQCSVLSVGLFLLSSPILFIQYFYPFFMTHIAKVVQVSVLRRITFYSYIKHIFWLFKNCITYFCSNTHHLFYFFYF